MDLTTLSQTGTYREHSVQLSSGTLALQYVGSTDKPLLVCLHGWLDNSASFKALAHQLYSDYQLLLIDLPGHGLSDPLPIGADYYIWKNVEVLYELFSQLQIDQVSLVGHSMGGIVASLFAGTFPDRVQQLILLDSLGPMVTEANQAAAQLANAIKDMFKPNSKLRVFANNDEALIARKKLSAHVTDDALLPIVMRNLMAVEGGFSWRTDKRLRHSSKVRLTEDQLQAFFVAIKAKVLVILAKEGIIPKTWQDARLPKLTTPTVITLPGHHHFHSEPKFAEAIAKAMKEFLSTG